MSFRNSQGAVGLLKRLLGLPASLRRAWSEASDSLTQMMQLFRDHLAVPRPPPGGRPWAGGAPTPSSHPQVAEAEKGGEAEKGEPLGRNKTQEHRVSGRRNCPRAEYGDLYSFRHQAPGASFGQEQGEREAGMSQGTRRGVPEWGRSLPRVSGAEGVASKSAFWKQSTGLHPHDLPRLHPPGAWLLKVKTGSKVRAWGCIHPESLGK